MRVKIRSVLVGVVLFGLGYVFHSVPVLADSDYTFEILQELRTIDGKLGNGSMGSAEIYKVSTSIGYDHTLKDGYTAISGAVKGFACDKDNCYVVVQ